MVALAFLLLTIGCSGVAGKPLPAPNLKPRPLTGDAIKNVLLDQAELSTLLHWPPADTHEVIAKTGGADQLGASNPTFAPPDCFGVVNAGKRSVYEPAGVQRASHSIWALNVGRTLTISVDETAVALGSAADAAALFAKFAEQWKRCNGVTATYHAGKISFRDDVDSVTVTDSMLEAKITGTTVPGPGETPPKPVLSTHTLGVRVNCLVEMEIAFLQPPGSQAQNDTAVQAEQGIRDMMDKVGALG